MSSPLRRQTVTVVPHTAAACARKLQVSPAELVAIDRADLKEVMIDLNLTLPERAQVYTYMQKVRDERPTAGDGALRKEKTEAYPWLHSESRALQQLQQFEVNFAKAMAEHATDPFVDLRRRFEAAADAGLISPDISMVLAYVLYAPAPHGTYLLASLLLDIPQDQRLTVHNWGQASLMPEAMKMTHGSVIASLKMPLWPPNATDGEHLNAKLLAAASSGSSSIKGSGLFAPGGVIPPGVARGDGVGPAGAGTIPIVQLESGGWAADTGVVERAFASLRKDFDDLRSDFNNRSRRPVTYQPQQAPQLQRHQQPPPPQHQQPYRQQPRSHQYPDGLPQGGPEQPVSRRNRRQPFGGSFDPFHDLFSPAPATALPNTTPSPPPPPPLLPLAHQPGRLGF